MIWQKEFELSRLRVFEKKTHEKHIFISYVCISYLIKKQKQYIVHEEQ